MTKKKRARKEQKRADQYGLTVEEMRAIDRIGDQIIAASKGPLGLMTEADAHAIARAWAAREIAPEDFDSRINEWRKPETIDEAIARGEIDRRQRQHEIERRMRVAGMVTAPERFQDFYPLPQSDPFDLTLPDDEAFFAELEKQLAQLYVLEGGDR